ncbi:MAG: ABC transporter substrate-binding protein [Fusobacterium sp.]|uniref:ABC transporter substrate-binding protein n=1 Tax=Fusobacterium sp. TaxID=68766 RepID=UPI0026DD67FE|nr:ABC transporter substrate-binding protein [Fusobacterium sp.]MDO4690192.1 ABC transporter substrate-binding protein [Fusobacterium sp.]
MKKLKFLLVFMVLFLVACGTKNKVENKPVELKKVDFLLDWVPNTNHTGLFVAKEKGYFAEEGIDLDIKQPANESTSGLVINNKAPMGIYFQDYLAPKLAKGAGVTAVAAIIENNTSGIISDKKFNIQNPKDLENHKYGTWDIPIELAMLKIIMENQGGDFSKVTKIPNTDDNSITNIANGLFDFAAIYYGWDKIMADNLKIETNFFYFKDYADELNFYSPIIIANNDYLKENAEEAKKILKAIKKGYQYAMEHPEESADILIKHAPELSNKRDFVLESQKYLSKEYASNKEKWGYIDAERWNKFYNWINANNLLNNQIPENTGFSNDYLE